MARRRAILSLACVASLLWVALALAQPTPQAYLPLVAQPEPPPTNTATATVPVAPPTATQTATATATATFGPSPTPTLPPAEFAGCGTVPSTSAPNYPIRITGINKLTETVELRNVSGATVDLTGWYMCSVVGGQHHPIGQKLPPGIAQGYKNSGGPIWNNTTSDPGALWNPQGRLVAYFPD